MKKILLIVFILLTISHVSASDIALIVKNATNLDYVHEYRINRVLRDMGFNVILIDKNNAQSVDYNNYVAIVVAGRPSNVYPDDQLDSFVASLPINRRPSVVVDSAYPDDFGWIYPGAISTLFSNRPIYMTVTNNQSVFSGYNVGDRVRTHIIDNQPVLDIETTRSALNSTASLQGSNLYSAISVAEPGTQLLNGDVTTARVVFFGVTEPLYWTDEVEGLFKNSVNWVLYSQLSGIPEPILTGEYSLLTINIYNDRTQQFLVDLGKDMTYDKFWDPNKGVFTDLRLISPNNYALDVNGDGRYEYAYENGVLHPLPDLIIESLIFGSQPQAGEQLNVTVIVKNTNYIARNFRVDTLLDTTIVDSENITVLHSNQTYTINVAINNIPAGQHEVKAIADSGNEVFEANEDNNVYTRIYVTSALPQEEQPSAPSAGARKKIIVRQQGDINFTMPKKIEIEQGQSTVISGILHNPLNYSLYNISFLVRGEGFSTAWYTVEPEEINELKSNESRSLKISINIPQDAPIYTYQLIVKALTRSEYGSRVYTETVAIQIKEKPKPPEPIESTITTTTITQEQPKSPITGLVTFVKNNWKLGLLVAVLIAIFIMWNYYPKIAKYFEKSGYIIGKGWKQPKKKR